MSSKSTAKKGQPIRPAALMRGAREKLIKEAVMGFSLMRDSFSSMASPTRRVLGMRFSPKVTMERFSPVSCITSATVPMAARSAYSSSSASCRSAPPKASTSFSATPTPASSRKG